MSDRWDITALLNSAAGLGHEEASVAQRHLWLVHLLEWLRSADDHAAPQPVARLKVLLDLLDQHPHHREDVLALLNRVWQQVQLTPLLGYLGFSPRGALGGELLQRLRRKFLPLTPETCQADELFVLLFAKEDDAKWLDELAQGEDDTLSRLEALLGQGRTLTQPWSGGMVQAMVALAVMVRAAGLTNHIRQRIDPALLVNEPFRQLARSMDRLAEMYEVSASRHSFSPEMLTEVKYLRALLDRCRDAADSVLGHLETNGVSVDLVFGVDQIKAMCHRLDALLTCLISAHPAGDWCRLMSDLVRTSHRQRSVRELLTRHYSLLARKVAERSAETGEHYITRDKSAYDAMLKAAAGGGAVIAVTVFLKFFILALGMSAFWSGFWAGVNYAASFLIVQALHFTVATKQPAMTAPALAHQLGHVNDEAGLTRFVDEVTHLIRSQAAGIFGNIALVVPLVALVQGLADTLLGHPLVSEEAARYTLHSLTLWGPTVLWAACTGVLLFASSIIAGWCENWFVWHRLDSALQWNPVIRRLLGPALAQRWSRFWRDNVSSIAANVSLGMLLGLLPAIIGFFAIPFDVRHVTLASGQLTAAVSTLGSQVLHTSDFWWCVAGVAMTGALNLGVSFMLAFRLALRSRGIALKDRSRIYAALRQRAWSSPWSFLLPPKG